jgi:hypothetical protein
MTEPSTQANQVLGEHGEPCRGCGAPLAVDQRYCLNCGLRRGEPRVEYQEHLNGANGVTPPEPQPAAQASGVEERLQRDYGPLAAVGGIAVLGLMLLVGVLIGKGSGEETQTTAPPIIRVDGAGDTTANEDSGQTNSNASNRASGKSRKGGNSLAAGGGGSTPPPVTASDDDLEALQGQSPEDYQRSSARLPDTIATPGAPPPTDNVAPGGGSGGGAVIR